MNKYVIYNEDMTKYVLDERLSGGYILSGKDTYKHGPRKFKSRLRAFLYAMLVVQGKTSIASLDHWETISHSYSYKRRNNYVANNILDRFLSKLYNYKG